MNDDNVYWVVQERTRFFGTWKPVKLFKTHHEAYWYESIVLGGGPKYKVDRVELYDADTEF